MPPPSTARTPDHSTRTLVVPPSEGVVNVRDFGAVGNGTIDDTDSIQQAIDSLADSGGTVFFPAGRYYVTGQLVLPNNGAAVDTRQHPYVFTGVGAFYDTRQGIVDGLPRWEWPSQTSPGR